MQKIIFEVCANSLQSAIAAEQGGADRIELCAQLDAGGVTPSAGSIELAVKKLSIPVFVLIRPRSGDFVYDEADFEVMKKDIEALKNAGAAGVVAGILTPDGDIDVHRTSALVQLAKPMSFTFHRAFDRTRDPIAALEDVISCGADRILTSGLKASALEGKELLKALVEKAKGRIVLLAGAGINPQNVSEIIQFTGVTEVHASCSVRLNTRMNYIPALNSECNLTVTDPEKVKQIVSIIKDL